MNIIKYCRPPPEIRQYKPLKEVVFFKLKQDDYRNIYYLQDFNDKELENIKLLKQEISKHKVNLPSYWGNSELLKYIYGSNFKIKKAFKDMISCLRERSKFIEPVMYLDDRKIIKILV